MTLEVIITLFIVLAGTVLIGWASLRGTSTYWQRILLLGVVSGLLLYSGLGAAYPEVPAYYLVFYFGFLLAFVLAFIFFSTILVRTSQHAGHKISEALAEIDHSIVWPYLIITYLFLHLVPLFYPQLRLHLLVAPPSPDLLANFTEQFEYKQIDIILKIANYARLLMAPFFLVALYRYRNHMRWVILTLLVLLYVQYVDGAYLGRGRMVMTMGMVGLVLWVSRPRVRLRLSIATAALLPFIVVAFYYYGIVRIGGAVEDGGLYSTIESVIYSETSFPVVSGMPLIYSKARVDLGAYLIWIATLPVPKILTGEISGARITYEISEIVLGGMRGAHGWFVILPGLVAESVYIGGKYFFWLHGLTLGFISALLVRLIERTPQFLFLNAHIVLLFAYVMNRAGIGAVLPVIVNEFLLFYIFVFISISRRSRSNRLKQRHYGLQNAPGYR